MASQPFPPRQSSEASQAGILTWGQILASLSDILLPIVVVRFVEIAEVGAIVALLLIYRTTAAILTAGFPRTVLYFLAEGSRGARKAVVRFLNLIMFCLAAAVAALLVLVRWIGPEVLQLVAAWAGTGGVGNGSELDEAFRFLPLLGIYAFTDLPVRLLRDILIAEGRAGTAALFAIAGSIGSTLVILVPVILGYGIPGVVVGHLVLGPLMLGWHVGLLRSLYGGAVRDRAPAFKTIVRYAVPLGFTEVVSTMLSSLDLWLVLLFLSVEQVALYKSGAWQLPVLGSLAYIVGSVYTPRFTRMFRAGEKREALAMWRVHGYLRRSHAGSSLLLHSLDDPSDRVRAAADRRRQARIRSAGFPGHALLERRPQRPAALLPRLHRASTRHGAGNRTDVSHLLSLDRKGLGSSPARDLPAVGVHAGSTHRGGSRSRWLLDPIRRRLAARALHPGGHHNGPRRIRHPREPVRDHRTR